jgi:hypothetical protein
MTWCDLCLCRIHDTPVITEGGAVLHDECSDAMQAERAA